MIDVRNIQYERQAHQILQHISFQVPQGAVCGLVGPNGAGKSTLLSIIAAVLKPTAGDVLLAGKSVTEEAAHTRPLVGYVPQDIALYPTLSVQDNLKLFASLGKVHLDTGRLRELLDVIGLWERRKDKVMRLSGGMMRRLNIGAALVHRPQVLLMDEPTVGVDIVSKRELLQFIHTLARQGQTIVYTSHDAREIERICSQVVILNAGKLKFNGTVAEARLEAKRRLQDGQQGAGQDKPEDMEDVLAILGEYAVR